MVKSLIILSEAEQDIIDAYDWYQNQELGLGEEFLRCVDASIQFMQRNPEMYEIALKILKNGVIDYLDGIVRSLLESLAKRYYRYCGSSVLITI